MQIVEGIRAIFSYFKAKVGDRSIISESIIEYNGDKPLQDYDLIYKKWFDENSEGQDNIIEGIYVDDTTFTDYDDNPLVLDSGILYIDIEKGTSYYFDMNNEVLIEVGSDTSELVSNTRQINTDSTMKGGGNLSTNRTFGVADNMIPATATVFSGDVDTLKTPQNRYAVNNITLANHYPVENGVYSIQVYRNTNSATYQFLIFRPSSSNTLRFFSRFLSDNGLTWSPYTELANDADVVHKTGNLAETITGAKTFQGNLINLQSSIRYKSFNEATSTNHSRIYKDVRYQVNSSATASRCIFVKLPISGSNNSYWAFDLRISQIINNSSDSVTGSGLLTVTGIASFATPTYSTGHSVVADNFTNTIVDSVDIYDGPSGYGFIIKVKNNQLDQFQIYIENFRKWREISGIDPTVTTNYAVLIIDTDNISSTISDNGLTLRKNITNTNFIRDPFNVKKSGDTMTGPLSTPAVVLPSNTATAIGNMVRAKNSRVYYANEFSVEKSFAFYEEVHPTPKPITSTSYTISANDYDKWLVVDNASEVTITITVGALTVGRSIKGRQAGLGQVKFVPGLGMTLLKAASDSLFTAEQNAVFEIFFESPTQAIIYGRLELE